MRKAYFTKEVNIVIRLKEIREKKGMSQEQLAQKSQVSRVTISNLETGKQNNITSETLMKLSNALDEPVDSFLLPSP